MRRSTPVAACVLVGLFLLAAPDRAAAEFLPGQFISYSQESWGGTPAPGGAAQLLMDRFDFVYPTGSVEVGVGGPGGFSAIFTSAPAVLDYLPASGGPDPLNADLLDPTSSSSGVFGGQVLALRLNVDFNDAGYLAGTSGAPYGGLVLTDMVIDIGNGNVVDMSALNGLTVRQFLGLADRQLGGGGGPYDFQPMSFVTQQIAAAFEGGTPTQFAQDHLVSPIPEPSSALMALTGVTIAAGWATRRRGANRRLPG